MSRGTSLIEMILVKPIDYLSIVHYISNFATIYAKSVISLSTPDSILVVFLSCILSLEERSSHETNRGF